MDGCRGCSPCLRWPPWASWAAGAVAVHLSSVAAFLAASGRPDDLETVGRWAALCVLAGACCGVSAGLIRWASAGRGRLLGAPAASGGVSCVVIYIVGFRAGAGPFGALL